MAQQPLTVYNAIDQLFPEDMAYCERQYERYWTLLKFQSDYDLHCLIMIDELRAIDKTAFIPGMKVMEKWSKQFNFSIRELTTAFITCIEDYFNSKYSLPFKSFLNTNPDVVFLTQLPSYKPIIYNILRQIGPKYFAQFPN
jgi:hypothetical protein